MRTIGEIRNLAVALQGSVDQAPLEERQAALLGLLIDMCDATNAGMTTLGKRTGYLRARVDGGVQKPNGKAAPADAAQSAPQPDPEPTAADVLDGNLTGKEASDAVAYVMGGIPDEPGAQSVAGAASNDPDLAFVQAGIPGAPGYDR